MVDYQPAITTIGLNLLCSIPVALFFIRVLWRDIVSIMTRRSNPDIPYLRWQGDVPLPQDLNENHEELSALGFVKVGAYERDMVTAQVMYWCYIHPNNPIVFVTLTNGTPKIFTQFLTVFDDEVIMTFNGFTLEVDASEAIVNTVSGNLSTTYHYHQRIVETEQARFGIPFKVQSANELIAMLERSKNKHLNEMFSSYYLGQRGILFVYWIIVAVAGIVGIILTLSGWITMWQAQTFGWILSVLTIIGIIFFGIFASIMSSDESEAKRKKAKLKEK